MKVYFCGSIRGGRDDAALYHRIIGKIKEYGTVLTEHIGDLALNENLSDNGIWRRDTNWLIESDALIAECTQRSIGVGYELAFAEARKIPVHVFYREDSGELSAMVNGNPNFSVHFYQTEDELFSMLEQVMKDLLSIDAASVQP